MDLNKTTIQKQPDYDKVLAEAKIADKQRASFLNEYSPENIRKLEGADLLRTIFYNDQHSNSLCKALAAEKGVGKWAQNVGGRDQEKWILYYGHCKSVLKNNTREAWIGGVGNKKKELTLEEAIELGTEIRDHLLIVCDYIKSKSTNDPEKIDYNQLQKYFDQYFEQGNGLLNQCYLKYIALNYPNIVLPVFDYSKTKKILRLLGEPVEKDESHFSLIGKLARRCKRDGVDPWIYQYYAWKLAAKEAKADAKPSDPSYKAAGDSIILKIGSPEHNVIYFGIPGCGKSFYISHVLTDEAEKRKVNACRQNFFRVTFYPDYSNADFVGQIQPKAKDNRLSYEFVPGPFVKALTYSLKHPDINTIFVIEELNRGNAASIFGDIFQLLDRDETGKSEFPITNDAIREYLMQSGIPSAESESYAIYLPSNFYFFATINTSDQNVFPLDTAFKRRWSSQWIPNQPCDFGVDHYLPKFFYLSIEGKKSAISWNAFVEATNKKIIESNRVNGTDKQIGYYFITKNDLIKKGGSLGNQETGERFAGKVLQYLWSDAFALDHHSFFKDEIASFEEIMRIFQNKKLINASDLFDESFVRSLPDNGDWEVD